jgi:hypothetical protein
MTRLFAAATLLALVVTPSAGTADKKDTGKEALKELNDFIGEWDGNGGPDKPRSAAKDSWVETISWGWRFKGDDVWLTMDVKKGKHLKSGELRYLPEKKHYQFTAIDVKDARLVYDGEFKDGVLALEHTDPKTMETQRLVMNLAGDGARFIYRAEHKTEGGTLFVKDYKVGCTKKGESLGAVAKKNECVVSGGLGTIPVSYNGETFYVCCSGCKDAFGENPAKYVAEFKAKKGK